MLGIVLYFFICWFLTLNIFLWSKLLLFNFLEIKKDKYYEGYINCMV